MHTDLLTALADDRRRQSGLPKIMSTRSRESWA
jgi:hypothetical protein